MTTQQLQRAGRDGPSIVERGLLLETHVLVEVIRDIDGVPTVINSVESKNTAVNSGKKQIMRLLAGQTSKAYDKMRIGTSGAAVVSNQVNVLSPVASTLTSIDQMTIDSGRTYKWINSYASGGGSISATNIQEVCLLREGTSPGGSAWNRSTFTAVSKTTSDKLKITYRCRVT